MRIGRALVIHRDIEESGGAERLAGWFDFLEMAAERFLALVETEHRLKGRRRSESAGLVLRERVVQTMTNRSLEGLMQNPPPAYLVELAQFGLELGHLARGPMSDRRCIEPAQLSHMEERPRALDTGRRLCGRQPRMQPAAQIGQRTRKRELLRDVSERRTFEHQPDREIASKGDSEIACRNAIRTLFDLAYDARPSAQREQLGGEKIAPLTFTDTELDQRMLDRRARAAPRGPVLGHQLRQGARPNSALGCQRRVVDLQKTAVDSLAAPGHRPVREALIEIAGEKANQRRVNPAVDVELEHRAHVVAVPNRRCGCR